MNNFRFIENYDGEQLLESRKPSARKNDSKPNSNAQVSSKQVNNTNSNSSPKTSTTHPSLKLSKYATVITILGDKGTKKKLLINSIIQDLKQNINSNHESGNSDALVSPETQPISETETMDTQFHKYINIQSERNTIDKIRGYWRTKDAKCLDTQYSFILPQSIKFMPPVKIKYSPIAELIIGFPEEHYLRNLLFNVHLTQYEKNQYAPNQLQYLTHLYSQLVILPTESNNSSSISPLKYQNPSQIPLNPHIQRLLGKRIRYQSSGSDFYELDRIFIREKLKEILNCFGCFCDIELHLPSSVLENNIEINIIDTNNHLLPRNQSIQSIYSSDLFLCTINESGISQDLKFYLSDLLSARKLDTKCNLMFLDTSTSTSDSSMVVNYSFIPSFKKLVSDIFPEMNVNVLNSFISSIQYFPLRILDYFSLSFQTSHFQNEEIIKERNVTNIPKLLNLIKITQITKSSQSLITFNKQWMTKLKHWGNVEGVTRSCPSSSDRSNKLMELIATFREIINNWKLEWVETSKQIDSLLNRKAKDCETISALEFNNFKKKFMQSGETCRMILHPKYEGRCLGADLIQLSCGEFLTNAPVYWRSLILDNIPQKLEQIRGISSTLHTEALRIIDSNNSSDLDKIKSKKLIEFFRSQNENSLVAKMHQIKQEIHLDASPLVQEICLKAVREKILQKSGNLQNVRQHHNFLLKALPTATSAAHLSIQEKFTSMLYKASQYLDHIISTITSIQQFNIPSSSTSIPISTTSSLPNYHNITSSSSNNNNNNDNNNNNNNNNNNMSSSSSPSYEGKDVDNLPFRVFDAKNAMLFSPKAWSINSFGSQGAANYLRFKNQLKEAKLKIIEMVSDPSSQFRALAHQVYGSEEAHSVIRLLSVTEIYQHPSLYSPLLKGKDITEYVCQYASPLEWGDHITLYAMANACGADIFVYSPIFPLPIRIQANNKLTENIFCVGYIKERHYVSLIFQDNSSSSDNNNDNISGYADRDMNISIEDESGEEDEMMVMDNHSPSTPSFLSHSIVPSMNSPSRQSIQKNNNNNFQTSYSTYSNNNNDDNRNIIFSSHCHNSNTDSTLHNNNNNNNNYNNSISNNNSKTILSSNQLCLSQASAAVSSSSSSSTSTTTKNTSQSYLQVRKTKQRKLSFNFPGRRRRPALPLSELCISKVIEYIHSIPHLQGALPEEIVQRIITKLIESGKLSSLILEKLIDPSITSLTLNHYKSMTDEVCTLIASKCPNLLSLSLMNCVNITNEGIISIFQSCHQLENINLEGCNISDVAIIELSTHCHHISSLRLDGCMNITSRSLHHLSLQCPNIEHLSLKKCRNISGENVYVGSRLRVLDLSDCDHITDDTILEIANHTHYLTSLKLSGKKLTEKSLNLLVTSNPQLQDLEISSCDRITDHTIQLLLQTTSDHLTSLRLPNCSITSAAFMNHHYHHHHHHHDGDEGNGNYGRGKGGITLFSNLQKLDLSRCYHITDEALFRIAENCGNLTYLNLSSCEGITEKGLIAISSRCSLLKHLNLSQCPKISDDAICHLARNCRALESLILRNSHINDVSLCELSKYCHQIKELDLSFCEKITDEGLDQFPFGFPKLEVLSLEEITSLTDESIQKIATGCSSLTTLKLAYCTHLTDLSIRCLVAGCPDLSYLDVSFCNAMNIDIFLSLLPHWSNLKVLIMKGNNHISSHKLIHPSLQSINLSWSKNLGDEVIAEMAKGCPQLHHVDVAWCVNVTGNSIHKLVRTCPLLTTLNVRGCTKVSPLIVKVLSTPSRTISL